MSVELIIGLIVAGVAGFIGWLIREKFKLISCLSNRVIVMETKLDVLGDISTTLNQLRTDVEIIKVELKGYNK